MRNYGINQKITRENLLYSAVKFKYFLLQCFTKNKDMRSHYKELFSNNSYINSFSYQIPNDRHCAPVCIITSDLILRENITELKKGITKLMKYNYSHKFLGGHRSLDNILETIDNMDNISNRIYSTIKVGIFDFKTNHKLSKYISYIEMYIRNINSSYLSIEVHIYFTDYYLQEIKKIINNDVTENKKYIMSSFLKNKKSRGGRHSFAPGEYNKAHLKSDNLYESFTSLKWLLFNEIQKYFPTIIHNLNFPPPSILFYQTDIDYKEKNTESFWSSLGIYNNEGQFINEAEKIFFKTNLSGRYERIFCKDMIYIYHDKKLKLNYLYKTLCQQTIHRFSNDYSNDFFKFIHLSILNDIYSKKLIDYKLKLNKIKLKKQRLYDMLKLRYQFEYDMDIYVRYSNDEIWEDSKERISELFNKIKSRQAFDYRYLTDLPISRMNIIKEQSEIINNEFDKKINIIQHLSNFKNESKNRKANFIMLFISIITLVLLIYPDWALIIQSFLNGVIQQLLNI